MTTTQTAASFNVLKESFRGIKHNTVFVALWIASLTVVYAYLILFDSSVASFSEIPSWFNYLVVSIPIFVAFTAFMQFGLIFLYAKHKNVMLPKLTIFGARPGYYYSSQQLKLTEEHKIKLATRNVSKSQNNGKVGISSLFKLKNAPSIIFVEKSYETITLFFWLISFLPYALAFIVLLVIS